MGVIKNKIIGIYGIYFKNELIYLGQSVNIFERWGTHKRELRNNKHHCKSFQEWFRVNQINVQDLRLMIIETISESDKVKLYELELKYFNTLKPKCWTLKPNIGFTPNSLSEGELREYNLKKSLKKNELYKANFDKYNNKIYELYVNEKKNLFIVAEELNISYSLVRRICHDLNIMRSHFESLSKVEWASWPEEEVREYLTGLIREYGTWPERARVAGVSISSLRDRALKYELFTPERVKTYKNVIGEFGEDYLKELIKEKYLYGGENIEWLCGELNCSRKNIYTLIEKFDLKSTYAESKGRVDRKNSSHEYEIYCFQCNKLFEGKVKHAKYCSDECLYESKLMKHICGYCSIEYVNTSKASKYCSRGCSYKANSVDKECARCHEIFQAIRHNSKYCCRECGRQ